MVSRGALVILHGAAGANMGDVVVDKKTLADLKPGDTVFVVMQKRRHLDRCTRLEPITRMGRKFGYISLWGNDLPFCLKTGQSHHKDSVDRMNGLGFDVYLCEADYKAYAHNEAERERLRKRLDSAMDYVRGWSPEFIRRLHAALDKEDAKNGS
jgi:hypothetical protein